MNLREMAPSDCKSLSFFYNELIGQTQSQVINTESDFQILLNRCVYKLSIEFHASFFNIPRIKNLWQLLEFFKLLVFMSKFYTEKKNLNYLDEPENIPSPREKSPSQSESTYDTVYGQNFELFCVNFFKKFINGSEVLPSIFNSESSEKIEVSLGGKNPKANTSSKKNSDKNTSTNADESYILNEIMLQFYEFISISLVQKSKSYSQRFRTKIEQFFQTFLKNLQNYYEIKKSQNMAMLYALSTSASESLSNSPDSKTSSDSTDSLINFVYKNLNSEKQSLMSDDDTERLIQEENLNLIKFNSQLAEVQSKIHVLAKQDKQEPLSLKNLCRMVINDQTQKALAVKTNKASNSVLSPNYILFQLPKRYANLVNSLSYNLIDDLYGTDFNVESLMSIS